MNIFSLLLFLISFGIESLIDIPPKRSTISKALSRRVYKKASLLYNVLLESITIKERAKPYYLIIAKFPINNITTK
jgi:hypothetical protein